MKKSPLRPTDSSGAQREYLDQEDNPDSKALARFDRVWIYTQGIAVAQAAEEGKLSEAHKMARWLCDRAVHGTNRGGEPVIWGWHFSANTQGDQWKDIRLVTGANAWAIQGLGVYLSKAVARGARAADHDVLLGCYQKALRGLRTHRRWTQENERLLMTAGFTSKILHRTTSSQEYYDTLGGALGYDLADCHYSLDDAEACTALSDEGAEPVGSKEVVLAENIVTEHNLDALSVLNHALDNLDALELSSEGASLRVWKEHLREGVFMDLWHAGEPEQRGRFVTGGEFDERGSFIKNPFSAVDNCSWLSLSVAYDELEERHTMKLAECLQYTIETFVSEKPYLGRHFTGAHYFPRDFRDPYIENTEAARAHQTSLYHLEATAGVILGLWYFADASPAHSASQSFRNAANHLWVEMNSFVSHFGLPYSTRPILNLMTELPSSTAAIWFLQLYHYHHRMTLDPDRPLRNYAAKHSQNGSDSGFSVAIRRFTEGAWVYLETTDQLRRTGVSRMAESKRTQAPPSPPVVASTGQQKAGVPALSTHVEEQALAIIVAVNRGDEALAGAWVQGLLSVAESIEYEGHAYLHFPVASRTDDGSPMASYYRTSTHMLSVYALLRFYGAFPGTPLAADIRRAVRASLESSRELFYDEDRHLFFAGTGGPTGRTLDSVATDAQGMLSPVPPFDSSETKVRAAASLEKSPSGVGKLPIVLDDNVYAFFALEAAEALGFDVAPKADLLKEAVAEQFWDEEESRVRPLLSFSPQSGASSSEVDTTEVDTMSGLVLYSLFLTQTGATHRAEKVLEQAFRLRRRYKPQANPGDTFADGLPGLVLATRAAGAFDPRFEQLARLAFGDVTTRRDESTLLAVGTLLAHHPKGFLGVHSGPMSLGAGGGRGPNSLGLRPADLESPVWLAESEASHVEVDARFRFLVMESIGQLLRSEYQGHHIDAFFGRLIALRDAYLYLRPELDNEWRISAYADKVHWLRTRLERIDDGGLVWINREELSHHLGVVTPL